jgi:hypothetical protein
MTYRPQESPYLAVSHHGSLRDDVAKAINAIGFYPAPRPDTKKLSASASPDPYMVLVNRMSWLVNNAGGLLVANTPKGVVRPQQASDVRLAAELQESGLLPQDQYPIVTLYSYEGVRANDERVVHTLLAAGAVSLEGDLTKLSVMT